MIQTEYNGPVATVRLNRKEKHNALNRSMLQQIQEIFLRLQHNADIRLAVLKSAGPATFCSGVDIMELAALRGYEEAFSFALLLDETILSLLKFNKPLIACIDGYALGGGLVLAATADIRIATTQAVCGIPAGRLGTILPPTLSMVVQQLTGSARLRELLFTGRRIKGREIVDLGLAHFYVDGNDGAILLERIINDILKSTDQALSLTKELQNKPLIKAMQKELNTAARHFADFSMTEDWKNRLQSFIERQQKNNR